MQITQPQKALSAVQIRAVNELVGTAKAEFGKLLDGAIDQANPVVYAIGKAPNMIQLKLGDLGEKQLAEIGKLKESTEQLESVLIKKMIETMEQALPKNKMDGPMGDLAKDMFRDTFSKEISVKNSMGISQQLFKQLSKLYLSQQTALVSQKAETTATPETKINENP
jgi:Rod binding domain-containing protein